MPPSRVPGPERWTLMETALHRWRRAHLDATWTEIEAELDRQVQVLRVDLLGEVATDVPDFAGRCPHCGGPLVSRGTRRRTVVAVTDGVDWIQRFIDGQRRDAVRILDFPHAVEHLATVAQAVFVTGTGHDRPDPPDHALRRAPAGCDPVCHLRGGRLSDWLRRHGEYQQTAR